MNQGKRKEEPSLCRPAVVRPSLSLTLSLTLSLSLSILSPCGDAFCSSEGARDLIVLRPASVVAATSNRLRAPVGAATWVFPVDTSVRCPGSASGPGPGRVNGGIEATHFPTGPMMDSNGSGSLPHSARPDEPAAGFLRCCQIRKGVGSIGGSAANRRAAMRHRRRAVTLLDTDVLSLHPQLQAELQSCSPTRGGRALPRSGLLLLPTDWIQDLHRVAAPARGNGEELALSGLQALFGPLPWPASAVQEDSSLFF